MIKLHIGCGAKYLPGYTHIDIEKYGPHIDIIHDVRNLSDLYESNTVDEIYACHILEHFSRHEILTVLREWQSLIKPGGILRLAVPNFESIVEWYNKTKDLPKLIGLLYGGQTAEWNYHRFIFDLPSITKLLSEAGFRDTKRYNWQQFLPDHYDDYSRAYLPHMDPSGILMSLNVTAVKV